MESNDRRRASRADRQPPSSIWGFAHVALLKYLSITPVSELQLRKRIVAEFLAVRTESDAKNYIERVREVVRAARMGVRPRRTRLLRPHEEGRPRTEA